MNNLLVYSERLISPRADMLSWQWIIAAAPAMAKPTRIAIRGKWGVVDVQDAVGGAKAAVEQGLCDEKRIAIMGSSAGGFTVLNSLIQFPGFFKAAICSYPVCDLLEDIQKTHKLERYYNQYPDRRSEKGPSQIPGQISLLQADKCTIRSLFSMGRMTVWFQSDQSPPLGGNLHTTRYTPSVRHLPG